MGLTFKNCPDIRNSKVFDIIKELQEFNINIEVYDPWVDVLMRFQKIKILIW